MTEIDREVRDAVAGLLVVHQRRSDGGGCICGWGVLGASHADHAADAIAGAGLLARITRRTRGGNA